MFSEELQQYIVHGQEEPNIEYKDSMHWKDNMAKLKIMKCMLAMANFPGGGVIVVGVKQKGSIFETVGMSHDDYLSYSHDEIARYVRSHSDPVIEFTIVRDSMPLENKSNNKFTNRKFCIIQVKESKELPVISTQFQLYNETKPPFPDNICLRDGVVYVRSSTPVESREIHSQEEWRDLLYRCIEKIQLRSHKVSSQPSSNPPKVEVNKKDDSSKYLERLKKDKLI